MSALRRWGRFALLVVAGGSAVALAQQVPAATAPAVPTTAAPVVPAVAGPSAPQVPAPAASSPPASPPVGVPQAPNPPIAPAVQGPSAPPAAPALRVAGPALPAAPAPSPDPTAFATPSASADPAAGAAPPTDGNAEAAGRDPLAERLLGADPGAADPTTSTRAEPVALPTPGWAVALAVGLVFAFAVGKLIERRRRAVSPGSLRVLQTTPLGRDGSLSVVEVRDADGVARRLLVGHGGGAPRLVVELAGADEFEARFSRAADAPRPSEARAGSADPRAEAARAESGRVDSGRVDSGRVDSGRVDSGRGDSGRGDASRAGAGAAGGGVRAVARVSDPPSRLTDEGRARAAGPRALAPRSDLIAEVLAERTDDDDSNPSDDPPDRPSGAYTFRGLLG